MRTCTTPKTPKMKKTSSRIDLGGAGGIQGCEGEGVVVEHMCVEDQGIPRTGFFSNDTVRRRAGSPERAMPAEEGWRRRSRRSRRGRRRRRRRRRKEEEEEAARDEKKVSCSQSELSVQRNGNIYWKVRAHAHLRTHSIENTFSFIYWNVRAHAHLRTHSIENTFSFIYWNVQAHAHLRTHSIENTFSFIYWNVRAHARVYVPSLSHTKTITVTEIPLFCVMVITRKHKTFFEVLIPMRAFCGILALITTPPQLLNVIAYMAVV